jgi:hypothetical protein
MTSLKCSLVQYGHVYTDTDRVYALKTLNVNVGCVCSERVFNNLVASLTIGALSILSADSDQAKIILCNKLFSTLAITLETFPPPH